MRVYFSGPHGAGKSSLINGLCSLSDNYIVYPDRLSFPHVDDPKPRMKAKLAKLVSEWYDQGVFHAQYPDKILLGDRCVYDSVAYTDAFQRLGWILPSDREEHDMNIHFLFDALPQNLVILNPPIEVLVAHLHDRWAKAGKKWREEDLDYLQAARDSYESISYSLNGTKVLYIDKHMKIPEEISLVDQWINSSLAK